MTDFHALLYDAVRYVVVVLLLAYLLGQGLMLIAMVRARK